MKRLVQTLYGTRTVVLFAVCFAGAMAFVFADVLATGMATTSPDDAPFYAVNFFVSEADSWLAGKTVFMWQRLFRVLAPVFCHELAYMICLFLLGLSGVYYLRTQRVSRWAACGGGLFLSLSGYLCTLFSAGHLGFFYMLASVFWSLGLINRCLEDRGVRYFAMLGCVLMWGEAGQPDVWVLAVALIAAYALWRTVVLFRAGATAKDLLWRVYPRFLITVVVAALLGVLGIRQAFQERLSDRDKQIAQVTQGGSQKVTVEHEQQKAFDRWIFATGWSLPPEDCAEFLVPGIFGNDSFRAPHPYWGRLGQPYAFQPGKMMPNYRQHTVYLGLVSLLLACFGVFAWFLFRRQTSSPSIPHSALRIPHDADVPFWLGVWVVCLVLAMGRYTLFYRFFYAIPYMDYLRAPVKFLHFAELATALLAGFGLEALLSDRVSTRLRRGFVASIAILAALLGLTALLFSLNRAAVEHHIAGLGLGRFAATLTEYSAYNCWRAMWIAVVATVLFWLAAKRAARGQTVTVAVAGLIMLGAADLAAVARRYVIPIDVRPFHEANLVIREMQSRTGGRPANVANYVTRNLWAQDWFTTALLVNGFPNMVPDPSAQTGAEHAFALAFQENPLRFWQVLGVRFVVLPRQQAEPLMRQGVLAPLCAFELLRNGSVRRAEPDSNAIVLTEFRQATLPGIYFAWTGSIAPDRQVEQACGKGQVLPVTDAPPPAAPSGHLPQPVSFRQVRGERGVFVTKGEIDATEPGLLVWNERYSPDLVARIDGDVVPLRQADGIWCAVEVPAGRHVLTCRMRYRPLWNSILVGVSLAALLAMFWHPSRRKHL